MKNMKCSLHFRCMSLKNCFFVSELLLFYHIFFCYRSRTSVSSFQHSICSSPKRSMEEVEASYGALSDSAIGKGNSVSDVVSKDVADAHGGAQATNVGEDDSVPCSSKRVSYIYLSGGTYYLHYMFNGKRTPMWKMVSSVFIF